MSNYNSLIIIWNIMTFIIYGIDKYKAIKEQYRISERTLILIALLGGGIGALFAKQIFRHKTSHLKFQILLPIFALITVLLLIY